MTICRNAAFLPTVLLAMLTAASCEATTAMGQARDYLAEGYLLQAYHLVETTRNGQLASGGDVDPEVETAYQELRYRMMIQGAREAIYAEDETHGLELIAEALQLRPGDEAALSLQLRADRKLAARATRRGQDLLAKAQLQEALAEFAKALEYVPDYPDAKKGVVGVQEAVSRLHGQAQQQFLEAIRKLPQFRFPEVEWHASAALTRDKSREDAAKLQSRAERELANSARSRGDVNRDEKNYGAALMEYRAARRMWSDLPGIDDDIAHMQTEVEVVGMTERAQLKIKSGKLDEASKLLDEAFEKSTLERGTINELRYAIRRRAGEDAYQAARDFELQGFKAEALAGFKTVAADWPNGLFDEQTRIGALASDIEAAEKAFAEGEAAEAAGKPAEALEHYKAAQTFYAKFRDVGDRIARLSRPPSGGS
jgi:tetratricopeptide (TPR) repeat protein